LKHSNSNLKLNENSLLIQDKKKYSKKCKNGKKSDKIIFFTALSKKTWMV
jgi:hypothetical protein